MKIRPLRLSGAFEIELEPKGDRRGYFVRTYDRKIFHAHGLATEWVQENQSFSASRHTLRGLHFQRPPHDESKLVRVLTGAMLDVLVDLRRSSPTYGEWESVELSGENLRALYVPRGFAHGFCTLTESVLVAYKHDATYAAGSEGGLMWNDPDLAIHWPVRDPLVSNRDRAWPAFRDFKTPFE